MGLFSKKKKYEKYESELVLRLHRALMAANKENTAQYKKIKILTKQLTEAYSKLCEMSVEKDKWYESFMALVVKYKELESEVPKAPSQD